MAFLFCFTSAAIYFERKNFPLWATKIYYRIFQLKDRKLIFFSVTNPAPFPKFFSEMMKSYFFPELMQKQCQYKISKSASNCNFYSTDPYFHVNLWYIWLCVLCSAGLGNKLVGVASLNAKWRRQMLTSSSPEGSSPVPFNSICIKGAVMSPITL